MSKKWSCQKSGPKMVDKVTEKICSTNRKTSVQKLINKVVEKMVKTEKKKTDKID